MFCYLNHIDGLNNTGGKHARGSSIDKRLHFRPHASWFGFLRLTASSHFSVSFCNQLSCAATATATNSRFRAARGMPSEEKSNHSLELLLFCVSTLHFHPTNTNSPQIFMFSFLFPHKKEPFVVAIAATHGSHSFSFFFSIILYSKIGYYLL